MEKNSHKWQEKAEVLIESLPFMRKYSNNSIVIKFGGHAMTKNDYINSFSVHFCHLANRLVIHSKFRNLHY